jgi:WD40 repeat protein
VTSIAWSCNGTSLAVSYGKTDHVSWCEHQSIISVWSIFRREFDPKKPDITIETLNCVSTLDFHPENPLILAGGSINGEIFIWNIDFDDSKE